MYVELRNLRYQLCIEALGTNFAEGLHLFHLWQFGCKATKHSKASVRMKSGKTCKFNIRTCFCFLSLFVCFLSKALVLLFSSLFFFEYIVETSL